MKKIYKPKKERAYKNSVCIVSPKHIKELKANKEK